MNLIELIQSVVVSVLISYLSFTNMLAERIEHLITPTDTPLPVSERTEEELAEAPVRTKSSSLVPRILLEHPEFQRAATIASKREEPVIIPDEAPLREIVKNALVNVYCEYTTPSFIRTTTGTGYFVNQKGVILTNAHVAQFLLLEDAKNIDGDVECVIRTGDPATPQYTAELLYISPAWILENADLITDEAPRGTGERDYALLYVSKTLDQTPLPTYFPFIPVDVNLLTKSVAGSSVVTAGYPAEALIRLGRDAELAPVIASTTVHSLYTFGSNFADIFSVSESPVGEQGASGGPIVNNDRDAIGLIVTKGDEETEGVHSLRAITLSYIDRTIIEETGFTLGENMQGDLAYRGGIFKEALFPFLTEILETELRSEGE